MNILKRFGIKGQTAKYIAAGLSTSVKDMTGGEL